MAYRSHAVYFRTGTNIDVNAWPPDETDDEGCQYNDSITVYDTCAADNVWDYSLKHQLENHVTGEWEGRWGDERPGETYRKGPRSPYFSTGSTNKWSNPRTLHNNHNWNNKSHDIP